MGDGSGWTRRAFGLGSAASALGLGCSGRSLEKAEGLATRLFRAIGDEARRAICFSADDPRRDMVQDRWAVADSTVGDLPPEVQTLALAAFRDSVGDAAFPRLARQMADDLGGFGRYHLATFGDPIADPARFEWVISGRHLTTRGDARNALTRGPTFFGHAAEPSRGIWAEVVARALIARRDPRSPIAIGALIESLASTHRRFEVAAVTRRLADPSGLAEVRFEAGESAWRLAGPQFAWTCHEVPHVHIRFEADGPVA